METLKTDYKNAKFAGNRKYKEIVNIDETKSFEDQTFYQEIGDDFGAEDINKINQTVNNLSDSQTVQDNKINYNLEKIEKLNEFNISNKTMNTLKGEKVQATDSIAYKVENLSINGNSFQKNSTGKNKLNIPTGKIIANGITISIEEDIVTINGTSTSDINIKLSSSLDSNQILKSTWLDDKILIDKSTSNYLSYEYISGIAPNNNAALRLYRNTSVHYKQLYFSNYDSNVDFTSPEIGLSCLVFYSNANVTFNNYKIKINIGTDIKFSQYTGDYASPNPDYPQNIETIKEIKIRQECKNLFNIDEILIVSNKHQLLNLSIPSGYYTFSAAKIDNGGVYNKCMISFLMKDGSRDDLFLDSTIEEPIITKYFSSIITQIDIYSQNKYENSNGVTTTFYQLMMERGINKTVYEKYYQTNIYNIDLNNNEFLGIDDEKDVLLVNSSGDTNFNKKIGKLILTGSEDWKLSNYSNSKILSVYYNIKSGINNRKRILCNKLSYKNSANASTLEEYISNGNLGSFDLRIGIFKSRCPDIETFKIWLSQNNIVVYYVLSQNKNIVGKKINNDIRSFPGTNNFYLESNLKTEMELTYRLDIKKYVDNMNISLTNKMNQLYKSIIFKNKVVGNPNIVNDALSIPASFSIEGKSYQAHIPSIEQPSQINTITKISLIHERENNISIDKYNLNLSEYELLNINNIKDNLFIDENGKIKITKRVRKIIFKGDETGWYREIKENGTGFFINTLLKINSPFALSNQFECQNTFITWTGKGKFGFNSSGTFWCMPDRSFSTIEEWKSWLAANYLIVYFVSEEEIIKLNNIVPIIPIQGTNIFKLDTNLETTFEINYYQDKKENTNI